MGLTLSISPALQLGTTEGTLCEKTHSVGYISQILFLENLHGTIKCANDDASCYLDGENTRRVMDLKSTAGLKLTISAITFKDGTALYGGGMYIYNANVILDLEFCVFTNCKALYTTPPRNGGGAIYVEHNLVTVNVYGTIFTGNTADSGHGDDIFRNPWVNPVTPWVNPKFYPIFTVHNTCTSPYSSLSPIQGDGLDTYSYDDYDYNSFGYPNSFICAPTRSPTLSPTLSPTPNPTASPAEDEEVPAESDLDGAGVAAFEANVFISLVGAVAGAAAANAFA
ncbi:hypothetical protein TrLO_g13075 [Triparma laevis f. longispina]|uniref:Uncharacterized protein n=1 Tax=Triparma laevis f. longispina TaxID=1714387 RepID=A0A9W7KWG4_9STRA|nr:hypothetical protein TrLO_g13075 [Triparma laevis f. longispina]